MHSIGQGLPTVGTILGSRHLLLLPATSGMLRFHVAGQVLKVALVPQLAVGLGAQA